MPALSVAAARRMLLAVAFAALVGPAAAQERMPGTIIMMRHAERVAYDNTDNALSPAGQARARALARTLEHAGISAIYISFRLRTRQTAAPLADALGLTPIPVAGVDSSYAADMLGRLRTHKPADAVLVIGHFNTFIPLLRAMGYVGDVTIADFEHDDVFVVHPAPNGPPAVLRLNYGEPSGVAGVPVTDSALIAVDQAWDSVRVRGDTAGLARILADEFVHTDETGQVTGKPERLALLGARGLGTVPAGRADDYRVQRQGSFAILTHRYTEGVQSWRNTHVYVWREGRWQAVAHHSSVTPQ